MMLFGRFDKSHYALFHLLDRCFLADGSGCRFGRLRMGRGSSSCRLATRPFLTRLLCLSLGFGFVLCRLCRFFAARRLFLLLGLTLVARFGRLLTLRTFGAVALLLGDGRFDFVDFGQYEKLIGFHGRALLFGAEDAVEEFRFAAELGECLFRCVLVAFFLGETLAVAGKQAFDDDGGLERRCTAVVVATVALLKLHADAVLLAPFEQFALEVHLLVRHPFEVEHSSDDTLFDKTESVVETAVEIDSAHQGFKGVAAQVRVVGAGVRLALDEAVDAEVFGQTSERLAAHDFGARVGEKSFALVGEVVIDNVAHHRFEHSVAEVFEAFVVEGFVARLLGFVFERLVCKRYAIKLNVVGIKPHDVVEGRAKLFVFAEKEFGTVKKVFHNTAGCWSRRRTIIVCTLGHYCVTAKRTTIE